VSKAHLLELSEEGFGRRAAVQPAALAGLWTPHALVAPGKSSLPFEGKAAIVRPP
jgi:hypothetical protein